jgi:hypothetical protein
MDHCQGAILVTASVILFSILPFHVLSSYNPRTIFGLSSPFVGVRVHPPEYWLLRFLPKSSIIDPLLGFRVGFRSGHYNPRRIVYHPNPISHHTLIKLENESII